MGGRRLVIMRHASAEPHPVEDAGRPLTAQGCADAARAGEFLRSIGVVPDHVLLSPAVRCLQTWQHVRGALGEGIEPVESVDQRIYSASPDSLLRALRSVPPETGTLMLVGHNPSIAYVASVLADADGPIEVMQRMLKGLPPGALAVYEPQVAWAELDMMGARATHFLDGSAA